MKAINRLKVRASHGLVGNDVLGVRFGFLSTVATQEQGYQLGESSVFWPSMGESTLGNPDLIWETSRKTDVGLDLGMFDDRLTLQVISSRRREAIFSFSAAPFRRRRVFIRGHVLMVTSERLIIRVWMHCWRCAILPRADSSTRCAVILLSPQ